jgi:nucleotidyltransferase/DNA polymerase involved in DNA repair
VVDGSDISRRQSRGIVSSESCEDKKYGIRSAMLISGGTKIMPRLRLYQTYISLYISASNNIMKILKSHADKFETAELIKHILTNRKSE